MCALRARTPNDAARSAAAGKSGAATRAPLRMPLPERPRLLPIPADGHVAPLPRAVARGIDERPAATVGAAGLEARPRAVRHGSGDGCEERPEPAGARGDEGDRAVHEPDREPRGARTPVEGARRGIAVDGDRVVRPQELPEGLAQRPGVGG